MEFAQEKRFLILEIIQNLSNLSFCFGLFYKSYNFTKLWCWIISLMFHILKMYKDGVTGGRKDSVIEIPFPNSTPFLNENIITIIE